MDIIQASDDPIIPTLCRATVRWLEETRASLMQQDLFPEHYPFDPKFFQENFPKDARTLSGLYPRSRAAAKLPSQITAEPTTGRDCGRLNSVGSACQFLPSLTRRCCRNCGSRLLRGAVDDLRRPVPAARGDPQGFNLGGIGQLDKRAREIDAAGNPHRSARRARRWNRDQIDPRVASGE
ncbi:hypothetical protein B0H14DRAFT_2742163, partial [Mycena olivaceomarginata]